jgi:hypothetical protein
MTQPGRFNALAAYVRLGGRVWMLGGGAASATLKDYDDRSNNGLGTTYSRDRRELRAGRFMVEYAAWRSELRAVSAQPLIRRYAGRHERSPDPALPYTLHLGELPALVEFKTTSSDPLPPQRSSGEFYRMVASVEVLTAQNRVIESSQDSVTAATLDTLFEANGGGLPLPIENDHNVMMTYYHGPSIPQGFLFTGFDLWTFQRAQCRAIVDFVLRRMWDVAPRSSGVATRR